MMHALEKEMGKAQGEIFELLSVLKSIEPPGLNPVSLDGEWEDVELFVDSGATETVISQDMLCNIGLKDG